MATTIKSWKEIEDSPEYKAMTPAQKKAAKRKYPVKDYDLQQQQNAQEKFRQSIADMRDSITTLETRISGITIPEPIDSTDIFTGIRENTTGLSEALGGVIEAISGIRIADNKQDLEKIVSVISSLEKNISEMEFNITMPDNSTVERLLRKISTQLKQNAAPVEQDKDVHIVYGPDGKAIDLEVRTTRKTLN